MRARRRAARLQVFLARAQADAADRAVTEIADQARYGPAAYQVARGALVLSASSRARPSRPAG
jgi:hypothetical protein